MGSIPAVKLLLTYEASPQLQHLVGVNSFPEDPASPDADSEYY